MLNPSPDLNKMKSHGKQTKKYVFQSVHKCPSPNKYEYKIKQINYFLWGVGRKGDDTISQSFYVVCKMTLSLF